MSGLENPFVGHFLTWLEPVWLHLACRPSPNKNHPIYAKKLFNPRKYVVFVFFVYIVQFVLLVVEKFVLYCQEDVLYSL